MFLINVSGVANASSLWHTLQQWNKNIYETNKKKATTLLKICSLWGTQHLPHSRLFYFRKSRLHTHENEGSKFLLADRNYTTFVWRWEQRSQIAFCWWKERNQLFPFASTHSLSLARGFAYLTPVVTPGEASSDFYCASHRFSDWTSGLCVCMQIK